MTGEMEAIRARGRRYLVVALGAFVAVLGVLWLLYAFFSEPEVDAPTTRALPVVSVAVVAPATHTATITALAEAHARNTVELRTQVGGRVVRLAPEFLPGQPVAKGTSLLEIDDHGQRTLVAEATNRLAQADLALLTEERMAATAAANWREFGNDGEPASPLVRREPQLVAAKAERTAAGASLAEAEQQLRHAVVRAPFDGVIERRHANLGETLAIGQVVGVLVDRQTIDLTVHLNAEDWSLLPERLDSLEVMLNDPAGGAQWSAVVRAQSGVIDATTRLRRLFLLYQREPGRNNPLLPGAFVRVAVPGRPIENTFEIPESALTRDSHVWVVDDAGRLFRHTATLMFSRNGRVYVRLATATRGPLRVAVHPLTSFVVGDRVDARRLGEER